MLSLIWKLELPNFNLLVLLIVITKVYQETSDPDIIPAKSGEPIAFICPRRALTFRSEIFFRGGRPVLLK